MPKVSILQLLRNHIHYRVTLAVSVPALLFLSLFGILAYLQVYTLTEDNLKSSLEVRAGNEAQRIGDTLNVISTAIETLAINSTLANGLIDSAGREFYLSPLLDGFSTINGVKVKLALCDFLGNEIAFSGPTAEIAEYRSIIIDAITSGQNHYSIVNQNGKRVLLGVEVLLYMRTTSGEGALVYQVNLDNIFNRSVPLDGSYQTRLLQGNFDTIEGAGADQQPLNARELADEAKTTDSITVRYPLKIKDQLRDLGLTIEISATRNEVFAPLDRVSELFLMLGITALVMVIMLSLWLGRAVTRPLLQLKHAIDESSTGLENELKILTKREDEIGSLAISFKQVLFDLRNINQTLEEKVVERTCEYEEAKKEAEIANERLRRAQRMEAVGQLTGGIAHDFNNLLAIMIGNAEVLEQIVAGNDRAKSHARHIITAVERGSSLTSRLLAFSRQQTLAPTTTNIGLLVDGLQDMLKRSLGETIELHVHADMDLWYAIVDPHQFENALVNLAVNARDAMPRGGKLDISAANITLDEIFVAQHEELLSGDYVMIRVTDTGHGVPSELLSKVFEPFFTTKDVGKGSGLGLSMVYGFVKQSEGHVTINSTLGESTSVTVFLPRSQELQPVDSAQRASTIAKLSLERILLVEDELEVQELSRSILQNQGYDVIVANNGQEAIERLRTDKPFDLLFTDIVLPGGMSGFDIASNAALIQPNIKILYTTGYPRSILAPDDEQQGTCEQSENVLTKPYRLEALLKAIRTLLDSTNN
jgi:signal transduction histidine kinase/ActR/RegA family two-component response regulator